MSNIQSLHAFEKIKILADARRLRILRLLMASPATLSQLARKLGQSAAWIRHHLKVLETAGLIELVEIRTTGRITEKYYRARADAFVLQEIILPNTKKAAVVFSGSHDLAMDAIASHFTKQFPLVTLSVGSLDGLLNLRQGSAN